MEEQILEENKKVSLSELAKIEVSISESRAELEKLKSEEEEYFNIRESKVKELIDRVLKESKEVFNEIVNHHTELSSFSNRLNDFKEEVIKTSQYVNKESQSLENRTQDADNILNLKLIELDKIKKDIQNNKSQIESDKKEIEILKEKLRIENKILLDKRQAFERAWKDLKK